MKVFRTITLIVGLDVLIYLEVKIPPYLIPQTRQETREFSVKSPDGSATFRNCTFDNSVGSVAFGDIPLVIDNQSQFPVNTPGLDIKRIIWVDFIFDHHQSRQIFQKVFLRCRFLKSHYNLLRKLSRN